MMLPASVRIFVCTAPQDMRRSFDGLALATQQVVGEDPRSGALFVYVNKRATRLKALWWDRNGYCLLCKRLHRANFVVPCATGAGASVRINGEALAELLAGVAREGRRKARKNLDA
jgi:transposase